MRCLQCGKEIPEGRKFCCSSCSAKYNNIRRQRRPWTEEQHLKVRKQRVCRFCGKSISQGTCCEDCKLYIRRVKTFERLQLPGKTLKDKNEKLVQLLKDLYLNQHLSLQEIWEKTGLRYRQVEIVFHTAGFSLRSLSESQKDSLLLGKRDLPGPLEKIGIRGYHTTWEGLQEWYRSSYELRFAKELDEQRVRYRIEDKNTRTKYWDSEKQKYRIAIPDFYLPDTNELVEVKSSYTLGSIQRIKDKFTAYRERGFKPKLLLNGEFKNIEN